MAMNARLLKLGKEIQKCGTQPIWTPPATGFANAPGNQLGVLGPEVQDEDPVTMGIAGGHGFLEVGRPGPLHERQRPLGSRDRLVVTAGLLVRRRKRVQLVGAATTGQRVGRGQVIATLGLAGAITFAGYLIASFVRGRRIRRSWRTRKRVRRARWVGSTSTPARAASVSSLRCLRPQLLSDGIHVYRPG